MVISRQSDQTLLIVADDLTGAADCAARCKHAGMPAVISVTPPALPLQAGAWALTSDSRYLPPASAARRVEEIVRKFVLAANVVWYKKIDSTLRGNIGSELDAMLDTLGLHGALVCPAFPAQSRGLREGYLEGPAAPEHAVHLPSLLQHQSRRAVAAISLDDVRAGHAELVRRLSAARQQAALLVVDALADDDLQKIIIAARETLSDALLCGSAGLLGVLAAHLAGSSANSAGVEDAEPVDDQAALLVVGSGSAVAWQQIEFVRRQGLVHVLQVGSEGDLTFPEAGDLLLHLPAPSPKAVLDGPAAREWAARLADAALTAIERIRPGLLVLVGGDTAINVLAGLGITRLAVVRELLPGMPLTQATDRWGRTYRVILKAGNHGDVTTLAALLRRARSLPQEQVDDDTV